MTNEVKLEQVLAKNFTDFQDDIKIPSKYK